MVSAIVRTVVQVHILYMHALRIKVPDAVRVFPPLFDLSVKSDKL